jgi:hypothetical protein
MWPAPPFCAPCVSGVIGPAVLFAGCWPGELGLQEPVHQPFSFHPPSLQHPVIHVCLLSHLSKWKTLKVRIFVTWLALKLLMNKWMNLSLFKIVISENYKSLLVPHD